MTLDCNPTSATNCQMRGPSGCMVKSGVARARRMRFQTLSKRRANSARDAIIRPTRMIRSVQEASFISPNLACGLQRASVRINSGRPFAYRRFGGRGIYRLALL